MGLAHPAAVICDLDGTLVDTVPIRITAWLRTLAEFELPADEQLVASLIGSDGRWLADRVAERSGRRLTPAQAEAIDQRSGEIYGDLNRNPRPLAGVTEFVEALSERRIPWAIATSSRPEQIGTSVAALELAESPVVIDGLMVSRAKPEPDLLLAAATALGHGPEGCWCVGDATWDMQAAKAAGMIPIGVTTGSADPAALRRAGAAAVVERLDQLVEWL